MTDRIYVDFNTMNQDIWSKDRRIRIHESQVTPQFTEGMFVVAYDETLQVQAKLEHDEQHAVWWARPDWSTRQDLPYPPPH